MSFRELVILLLGLAIVAVILRGLYVAIQARKGQIKLAIDKNIPQDVDLDALELAELPGGGARVVQRSDEAASNDNLDPIEQANARAESLALDRDAESVPVLMDSVTLGQNELDLGSEESIDEPVNEHIDEPIQQSTQSDNAEEFEAASQYDDPDDEILDSELNGSVELEDEIEQQTEAEERASQDDILLDYDAEETHRAPQVDGLASVQPDYPEDYLDEHDEEQFEDDVDDYSEDYPSGESSYEQESEVEDELEEAPAERTEPTFDPSLNDGLDDFSMTAGERIGYQSQPETSSQTEVPSFDDESEPDIPVKRTSLFSALRNKIAQTIAVDSKSDEEDTEDELDATDERAELTDYEDYESDAQHDVFYDEDESDEGNEEYYSEQQGGEAEEYYSDDEISDTERHSDHLKSESELPVSSGEPTDIRQHQAASQPTEIRQQSNTSQPSEVLVLNVMAHEGREFQGDALMHAVITSGLKFGEMNIFHLRYGNDSKGPVVFSLANILNPGTFDLNNMSDFSTIGVSLFLALPVAGNNYDAFEQMLDVAQELCESLDGELKDDHRNVMTAQTIEHYRQRVRDFELRQLKAAGSRG